MFESGVVNQHFHRELLAIVREQKPSLLEGGVEVIDNFNIYRSMRRGSESRAMEVGIDTRLIDLINMRKTSEENRWC